MKQPDVKTERMEELERHYEMNISELLRHIYVDWNYSKEQLADVLQINRNTASDWLERCGVYSKRLDVKK